MALDVKPFEESIQTYFDKLCKHHLDPSLSEKNSFATQRRQLCRLRKRLYYKLFVKLHSPYVLPLRADYMVDEFTPLSYASDVYAKYEEYIFNIRMEYGQVKGADKLEQCGDKLQEYKNGIIDSMLEVILSLSNHYEAPSEQVFQKSHHNDLSNLFQFDEKAVDLADALRSSVNWNDVFKVDNTSLFALPDGSFFKNDVPPWQMKKVDVLKESKYDLENRLTLFGGLTSSFTSTLDIRLSLPDLPKHPELSFVPPRQNEISVDEGFHELSHFSSSTSSDATDELSSSQARIKTISIWDGLSIWDEAVALEKLDVSKWEKHDSIDTRLENQYFCQLGKEGFDCMYHVRLLEVTRITGEPLKILHVTEQQMFRNTLYALIGVPSVTYKFYPDTCSMKPALNVHCPGLSIETLYMYMCKFAQVGTHYRQLHQFCQSHSDRRDVSGGLILNAFLGSIKEILHSFRSSYFIVLDVKNLTMMELWRLFELLAKQLKFLADICLCQEAFSKSKGEKAPKFPVGAYLLSYIYSLAVRNASTEQYPVLLFIFKCISVPYIKFLTDWLLEGVSNDPYNEFFVRTDAQYLRARDKYFWTQGFQMIQTKGSIPLFLDDLAENIFACGKAINLLHLIDNKHYLIQGSVQPPPIDVTYSWRKFEAIKEQCKVYIKLVNECEVKERGRKEREKLESETQLKEKFAKSKLAVEKEVKRIEELENKVKLAIRFKKKQEFDELKIQFDQALLDKKDQRRKEMDEGNAWIEEMKKDEDAKDAIKQKARDELIAFYENLTRKAEEREHHARWIIQRYELYDKRKQFIKSENEKILNEYNASRARQSANLDGDNDCSYDVIDGSSDDRSERANDQSFSLAKDLLYPSEQPGGPPIKPAGDKTSLQERIDCEGSMAKEAMYPSSKSLLNDELNSVASNNRSDDNQAKDLIYRSTSSPVEHLNESETPDALSTADTANMNVSRSNSLVKNTIDERTANIPGRPVRNEGGETKDLLYPSSQLTGVIAKDEVEQKVVEGSETKSLLYPPGGKNMSTDVPRSMVAEADTTKDLLYPTISGTIVPLVSPRSECREGGNETKELLYPTDKQTDANSVKSNTRGEYREDGNETKGLMYPTKTINNINDKKFGGLSRGGGEHKDEGSETKSLLYPKPEDALNIGPKFSAGTPNDEGYGMKNMLYPGTAVRSITDSHVIKEFEKPSEMQSIIYASGDNSTAYHVKDFEKPSTMQSIIYPTMQNDGEATTNPTAIKEFEKPSTLQDVIYPTNVERDEEHHHVKEFERPSTLQDVIYRSAMGEQGVHHVKEFENPSTMQALLYPDANDGEKRRKVFYKEFEPPTRIKEILYFGDDTEEEKPSGAVDVSKELTHQEIWMDYTPEPYDDNLKILSKVPLTYNFDDVLNTMNDMDAILGDADVIKKLPLETIVKRSLTIPIQAQISLVNKAVVKYFLEDLKIEAHFDAFRKFLLLEDGEFGHSLCHSLFEKIALGMKPQRFCQSMLFTNIIPEALNMSLYASKIDYSRQLKFSLKWMPDVFHPSDVAALDFLELRYRVPWPCNIVITENSITKYNKVFSFLLRLKKASWSLQNVWLNLKKAGFDRKAAVSPQLRQLHLFRHEMQHFVNNLERYIVNQIIHVSWQEFQEDLRNHVKSLDNLHQCHVYYLDKIIFRSLLSKNAAPVYNLINEMFSIIAKFESRLLSQNWESEKESGFVQHPLFGMLKEGHRAFKCGAGFLFSVIQSLVKRGYQDHLDDLLLQVNFNTYYNATAKTST